MLSEQVRGTNPLLLLLAASSKSSNQIIGSRPDAKREGNVIDPASGVAAGNAAALIHRLGRRLSIGGGQKVGRTRRHCLNV